MSVELAAPVDALPEPPDVDETLPDELEELEEPDELELDDAFDELPVVVPDELVVVVAKLDAAGDGVAATVAELAAVVAEALGLANVAAPVAVVLVDPVAVPEPVSEAVVEVALGVADDTPVCVTLVVVDAPIAVAVFWLALEAEALVVDEFETLAAVEPATDVEVLRVLDPLPPAAVAAAGVAAALTVDPPATADDVAAVPPLDDVPGLTSPDPPCGPLRFAAPVVPAAAA